MSAITIPEGFFPPPGVPFSTDEQRDVAVAMHNAGLINIQSGFKGVWSDKKELAGDARAKDYRLAPPKPRTVGPFESDEEHNVNSLSAWQDVVSAAGKAGFNRFRIKLTATAEEILP